MAVLSSSNLTLADWAKLFDPDGKLAVITNVLSQTNEVLEDCVFKQANGKTHHRVTIATGLPGVYWRQVNQGIPPTKATTAQVDEGIGMLEARSETDCVLAKMSGDLGKFRFGQSRMHLESMSQKQARTMFAGDISSDPASYLGLQGRYSSLTGAANSQNVIGGGGVGAHQTSIYLVGWGDETVHCTFPEGSQAGIVHHDLGEQTIYGAGGVSANRMQAYVDLYQCHHGLVVQDWRYCVRICNIDAPELKSLGGTQAPTGTYTNIVHKMIEAVYKLPNINMVRPAFYVNRLVHTALSRIAMEKSASAVTLSEGMTQFGTPRQYLSLLGVPIRLCDTLTNTEAQVS